MGDRVMVRDLNNEKWLLRIFDHYDEDLICKYCCEDDVESYMQCIPYNEHTWKLLGTSKEYKEE